MQIILTGCLVAMLVACGYRFAGTGSLPEGVQFIFIELLENRSADVALSTTLTEGIIDQFVRNRKNALVPEARAEAILSGIVTGVSDTAASRSEGGNVQTRRVQVEADLRLTTPEGKVVWSVDGIRAEETYNADAAGGEDAGRNQALSLLVERMAEQIYNLLFEDF